MLMATNFVVMGLQGWGVAYTTRMGLVYARRSMRMHLPIGHGFCTCKLWHGDYVQYPKTSPHETSSSSFQPGTRERNKRYISAGDVVPQEGTYVESTQAKYSTSLFAALWLFTLFRHFPRAQLLTRKNYESWVGGRHLESLWEFKTKT